MAVTCERTSRSISCLKASQSPMQGPSPVPFTLMILSSLTEGKRLRGARGDCGVAGAGVSVAGKRCGSVAARSQLLCGVDDMPPPFVSAPSCCCVEESTCALRRASVRAISCIMECIGVGVERLPPDEVELPLCSCAVPPFEADVLLALPPGVVVAPFCCCLVWRRR